MPILFNRTVQLASSVGTCTKELRGKNLEKKQSQPIHVGYINRERFFFKWTNVQFSNINSMQFSVYIFFGSIFSCNSFQTLFDFVSLHKNKLIPSDDNHTHTHHIIYPPKSNWSKSNSKISSWNWFVYIKMWWVKFGKFNMHTHIDRYISFEMVFQFSQF